MEDLIKIAREIYDLRKIPQFIFFEEINTESMFEVRLKTLDLINSDTPPKEIDFIINSPGGSPSDAYRIIRTLRNNFETINIIVPFWAKSAATLLSLGGTKIIMDEFGEFGPLDIQIAKERDDSPGFDRESALNDEYSLKRIENRSQTMFNNIFLNLYQASYIPINKNELSKQIFEYLAKFYEPLLKQLNPYKLGEKKRKLEIGEKYAERILALYNTNMTEVNKRQLVDYLINGCPDHGYIIDYSLISKFLPNVMKSTEISKDYAKLLSNLSNLLIINDTDITFVDVIDQNYVNSEENGTSNNSDSL